MTLDDHDKKLLRLMQDDANRTVQDYADAIGLSATPTARRIKRLSDAGVIRKQVSLLDPDALGLKTTLFVFIRTSRHDGDWLDAFSKGVKRMPEVVEFYRMGGDVDYLLKIMLPEISDYDAVYKRMVDKLDFTMVNGMISMEEMKFTTAVPTKYL